MNYFVNGRWVQEQALNASVQRAYQTLIMVGRFPIIALFITVDPEDVDVNVHPAKAEVRFRNPDRVIGSVHRVVRRGLITQSPVPELNTPTAWPSSRPTPPPFDPNGQSVPTEQPLWRSNFMSSQDSSPAFDSNPEVPSGSPTGPAIYQPFIPQPIRNEAN